MTDVLDALRGGFITSCQPVRGGAFDRPELVVLFARAAVDGGSAGLRIEGLADLRAVRPVVRLPIVGLVKRSVEGSEVFITPDRADIHALIDAGADIVAFDGTDRPRPEAVRDLIDAVHAGGRLAMADVATLSEGVAAFEAGADLVGTTLSGYAHGGSEADLPDLDLVGAMSDHGIRVVAEGGIGTPEQAAEAIRRGAYAVTVGTALTRPEWATRAFVDAVRAASAGD